MHIRKGVIAKQLIVSTVEQYGKTTPLYIAGNNNLMNFMEQTACQAKLTEIWNGNMAWNTSIIKVREQRETNKCLMDLQINTNVQNNF